MIEELKLRECINNKIKEYLGCANLENHKKIFDKFYEPLIKEHKFKEEWGNTVVPNCNGNIKSNMTPEHKKKYLEILTEKLMDHHKLVKRNQDISRNYKICSKPKFELYQAQRFAIEAFDEAFLMAKDSYKPKLREYHELMKEKMIYLN